jgi:uncharacterized protein with HEPN domain
MTRDDAWLLDIVHAARDILSFCADTDAQGFREDLKTQAAVMHRLMVIGEAAKRLSPEFRDAHPDQPWAQIAGMRDRLIHGYDKVRIDVVWQVVENDLGSLLGGIEPLVPDQTGGHTGSEPQ